MGKTRKRTNHRFERREGKKGQKPEVELVSAIPAGVPATVAQRGEPRTRIILGACFDITLKRQRLGDLMKGQNYGAMWHASSEECMKIFLVTRFLSRTVARAYINSY